MSIDVREDKMQHAELFGEPVLYTNWWIDRDTVPKGWYCYDIRGTDRNPAKKVSLEDNVTFNHAGSVLSPVPLKGADAEPRKIRGQFFLHGEEMDLEAFCEEHDLEYPADPRKYIPRPASPEEAGLFYAMPQEKEAGPGCIGHLRIDFESGGSRFHSTWHPRGPQELNTPEFRAEIDDVVNELRQGVLRDLNAMTGYCGKHGGQIDGVWQQNYNYVVETERYRYCLHCDPNSGDNHACLTAFDRRVQEMDQVRDQPEQERFGLTEAGRRMLQNAADPDRPHTYEWYVIENIRSGVDRVDHQLPLDEAIELYAQLDSADKRLGVTKDSIAAVDLVIRVDDREWFSEDWERSASFAEDPVITEAIQQMHQALDQPEQGMTMGW